MITELSPVLHRLAAQIDPKDLLLQKESWVYFTDKWSDNWKWVKGKLFRVSEEPRLVPYARSYILPASDYKDIDLSNSSGGVLIYPQLEGVLYQIALGMKVGDYILEIDIPAGGKYAYDLGYSGMTPSLSDADKRYLGAKRPQDSPAGNPLIFFYAIKDGPAIHLRPYILESVDYEKVTFEFHINKCRLAEILNPSEDQIRKATRIPYYSELTGF